MRDWGGVSGGHDKQRASYDAIVTIAALLGLMAVAPLRHMSWRHWAWTAAIVVTLGLFAALAVEHLQKLGPSLKQIENVGPR